MKSTRSHKQDQMAKLYDAEILPIWAARFGRLMLRDLSLPPRASVLDVGCGTGYPALEVLRRMDEHGRIIAIDPSPPLLNVARDKAGALGGKRIFFRTEGCEPRLSFADDVYDLVVSNLGLVDATDPEATLAEFARVTKPGGRVLVTLPLAGTFGEFYDIFREVLIKRDRTESLDRLDAWLARYPAPDEAERWLEAAGLVETALEHERFTLLFKSSREFFFAPVIEFGPLPSWKEVAGKGQEMQEVFWLVKEAIDAYFGDRPFTVTVDAGCGRGRKPFEEEARQAAPAEREPPTDRKVRLPESLPPEEKSTISLHTGEIEIIEGSGRTLALFDDDDDDL